MLIAWALRQKEPLDRIGEDSMRAISILIVLLAGCAGMSSISTVAPKFTGYPVEQMAAFFGAPERVSEAGSLTFYEWRIGQYVSEPDRTDVYPTAEEA